MLMLYTLYMIYNIYIIYIIYIILIETHGEEKLEEFMADFNAFVPNIQFTYEHG